MVMDEQTDARQDYRRVNGSRQSEAECTGQCRFESVFESLGNGKCNVRTGYSDCRREGSRKQ